MSETGLNATSLNNAATSVARAMLEVMPYGGFAIVHRAGMGSDYVETRIDVPHGALCQADSDRAGERAGHD